MSVFLVYVRYIEKYGFTVNFSGSCDLENQDFVLENWFEKPL